MTKKAPARNPVKLAFWVVAMLTLVGSSTILSQIIVGYLMVWILGAETFAKPMPMAIYSALSYCLAMVFILTISLNATKWKKTKKQKKSPSQKKAEIAEERRTIGLSGWPTWTDIGLAPVGFIVYLLLAAGLVAIFNLFPWFNSGEAQNVGFDYYVSGFDRVLAFLTLVVVAPVAEEVIFRGWLYGKMREKIAAEYSNAISIIVSSLLVSLVFGIVHLQWNVGVNVFALSIVLCSLREITGTIYAGILLHMLKNGVAFWLLYMMGMG